MRDHASFFSGGGGLDLGLERAGWRTVSVSEIDPYACALLAERGLSNLGDITALGDRVAGSRLERRADGHAPLGADLCGGCPIPDANLWTGGFPCQDLSIAGKRRGLDGERSGLALTFLALVERHRPPAVLLENVPGLLSSHGGRDMATLVGRLGDLGYGWAFRVLDAEFFGVPQRRRRVFILALRSGPDDPDGRVAAERAAAVLAVGTRCERDPPAGAKARPDAAAGARTGLDIAGSLTRRYGKGVNTTLDDGALAIGAPADPGGVRTPDGLDGRLDDRPDVAGALTGTKGGWRVGADEAAAGQLVAYAKRRRAGEDDPSPESWDRADVSPTLDSLGHGPRTATAIIGSGTEDDPLLPLGLDSHRYRVIGNGVAAPVAEWIGRRLFGETDA